MSSGPAIRRVRIKGTGLRDFIVNNMEVVEKVLADNYAQGRMTIELVGDAKAVRFVDKNGVWCRGQKYPVSAVMNNKYGLGEEVLVRELKDILTQVKTIVDLREHFARTSDEAVWWEAPYMGDWDFNP